MKGSKSLPFCNLYSNLRALAPLLREVCDYNRAEYRQIAIIVGSTTIGRVGMLSV